MVLTGLYISISLLFLGKFGETETNELLIIYDEKNNHHKENQAILENLNEGVITKSSLKGVKYFNTLGHNFL